MVSSLEGFHCILNHASVSFYFHFTVPPPSITVQPMDQMEITPATSAMFSVTATGGSLTYMWFKDGNMLVETAGKYVGTDSEMLFVLDLVEADEGMYRVTVTNIAGSIMSSDATLTVCK